MQTSSHTPFVTGLKIIAAALAVTLLAAPRASAQTGADTWVGNTSFNLGDGNWTGANNPPIAGDSWVFGAAGTSGTTLNNNLTALNSVAGITFNLGASAFTITNDSITLTGGITNSDPNANEILNFPISSTAVQNVTNAGTGTIALWGNVSGTGGGFNLSGPGTLKFTGSNSFTGASTIGAGSTLTVGGAGWLGGTTAQTYVGAIANSGVFNYNTSANETNSGIISSTGALNVNGPGMLTLNASPNTMSGLTTVNGGILQLLSSSGGNGNLQNSAITVNVGGELDINVGDGLGYAVSLPITNYGIVKKVNSQSETLFRPLILAGGSWVTTQTNIEQFESFGGYMQSLPNTANFFTGPGRYGLRTASCYINLATGSTLTFNLVVDQNASGAALIQTGPGTLILNATNTFTGGIYVSNGTVTVGSTGLLGSGSYAAAITNLGALNYNGLNSQLFSGTISNTGTFTLNSPATVTLLGALFSSGSLVQNGSGTVNLFTTNTANTYTGATIVSNGTLAVNSAYANTLSPITVNDGATFNIVPFGSSHFSPTTLNVGSASGATISVAPTSTTQAPLTPVTLNLTGNTVVKILSGDLTAGLSYPILSYTTLTGSGTLAPSNFVLPTGLVGTVTQVGNTFTLNVTSLPSATIWTAAINGTWDIGTTANWSTGGVGGVFANGSPVQFDDADNTGGIFVITNVLAAPLLSPGGIVVNNSAHNYTFTNTVILAGPGGLTKSGTGSLTNFGTNTYTGPTVINNGSLVAGATSYAGGGPFGINSALSLANVATASLVLTNSSTSNNYSVQIGSLSGGGTSGGNVNLGSARLTFGGDDSSQTYAGVISGTGGITQVGTGSLTLTGTNTFTGSIGGISGTLTIGAAGELGAGAYGGAITDTGLLQYSSSSAQTMSGAITGTGGSLTENGPGTLTIAYGGDTYSGLTTVNSGSRLIFSSGVGGSTSSRSAIVVNAGGELDLTAGDTLGYAISVPITNYGVIIKTNDNQSETMFRPLYMGGGTLTSSYTSFVSQYNLFGGFIQTLPGTSSLITGTGEFGLRTAGTYFGLATNSTLSIGCVLYQYTGGTALNAYGPGTLILSNVNTFTAGINLTTGAGFTTAGTLILADPGQLNTGAYAGNFLDNGAFIDSSTLSQTMSGVISGTGSLTVKGTGANLTLANVDTYSGGTVIDTGTLFLSGTGAITASTNIFTTNAGVLDVTGVSTPFTLGGFQALSGYGSVNGAVVTGPGSKVYAGNDGGFGTLTFSTSLTLGGAGTVNMDVGPTYNGQNDLIVVNGPVTANFNTIHLKAPSTLSPLDSSGNSYTLITASGGITGSFSSGVLWDNPPSNQGHYKVVTGANSVTLAYSSVNAPILTGSLTPANVKRNQTALITVIVTPGDGTITGVTIDTSLLGGSSTLPLVLQSGTTYTNSIFIPPTILPGVYGLTATATDSLLSTGVGSIPAVVVASTETWNGLGADANFDDNTNWASVLAPGYIGDSLAFAGTVDLAPNMDNSYATPNLSFSAGAGAFVIGTGNASILTLTGGVTNNSVNTETVNVPVSLAQLTTFNASKGGLSLTGGISDTNGGFISVGTNVLTIGGNNTMTGPVIVHQGTTTITGTLAPTNIVTIADTTNVNAVVNIGAAGTLNAGDVAAGFTVVLGNATNSTGVLNMVAGGNLVSARQMEMSVNGAGSYGAFEMSGGTANVNSYFVVGFNNGYGEFDMSAGQVNINTNLPTVGAGGTAATGVANISGGTFTANDTSFGDANRLGGMYVGENGNGTLNVSGNALLNLNGEENLEIGVNAGAVGQVDALGGTIFTGQVLGGAGTSTFNFNGGTVEASSGGETAFMTALGAIYVYPGGAIINDGGNDLTQVQPLIAPSGYGVQSITITNAGAGYIAPPIVTLAGGSGTGARAVATISGGVVNHINIVNPGTGYASGDSANMTVTLHGGGATVNAGGTNNLAPNGSGGFTKVGSATFDLGGACTYSNATTISGGYLTLIPGGSINNSAFINVQSGANFDVSQITGYTLGGIQTLRGSGTVFGAVNTASGAIVYPGTNGTPATLSFNNGGLTFGSGAVPRFDLSTSATGANDAIAINGSLTVFGNSIHLKALNPAANLDTADYILMTVSGGISGSFSTTPVWDVAPLSTANYSIQTAAGGTEIVLHYSTTPLPAGTATVTPNNVVRNQTVLVSVTVTSSANPISSVFVDATPIGGVIVNLVEQGASSTYTNHMVIPASTPPGPVTLAASMVDSTFVAGQAIVSFNAITTTEIWSGLGSDENWDTNPNWGSGLAPGYVGDSLVFAGTTALAPVVDQNYSPNGIGFASGAGSFVIGGGDTVTVSSGVTNNSANLQTLNTAVALSGNVVLAATTADLALAQPVSGSGTLEVQGPGNSKLLADNTFTGAITIDSGNLDLGPFGELNNGTYASAIVNNGTFTFDSSEIQTNSGIMSGSGALTANGSAGTGNLFLSASPNTFTGVTTVNGGILTFASTSGGNGCVEGPIVVNAGGELDINVADGLGYSDTTPITNSGIIKKLNNQPETLGTRGLVLNGGSLVTTLANDEQFESYASYIQTTPNTANFINGPGRFGLRTTTCFFSNAANATLNISCAIDQNVNGSGTPLNTQGPGTLILSGANFFTGFVNINGGILQVDSAETAGASGPLGTNTLPGSLLFGGGTLQYSALNANDYSSRFSAAGNQPISIDVAGQLVSFATVIAGAGTSLTVADSVGNGSLTLTVPETYTGNTTVNSGVLAVAATSSLNSASSIVLGAGGTLDVSALGSFTLGATASLTASGTASAATLKASGAVSLGSRPITLNYDGAHVALTVSGGNLSLNGNAFTVNGTPLAPGNHTVVQASSAITSAGVYTVGGTAIPLGYQGSISVVGSTVVLNITAVTPPTVTFSLNGNNFTINWTAAGTGFTLQTNSINVGIQADWQTYPGSTTVTSESIPINHLSTNVFFRLIH